MPQRLKGKIQAYSHAVNAGTVICENTKIYLFSSTDWTSMDEPKIGSAVIFFVEGDRARSVTVDQDS